MRFYRHGFVFVLLSLCYVMDLYAFVIHGTVSSYLGPVGDAKIYETYNDVPVAVSGADGSFSFETGSNAIVEIYAEKKGYKTASPVRVSKDESDREVQFVMPLWWEKKRPLKIYTILDDDKDCIINNYVEVSKHCPDILNDYNPRSLERPSGLNKCSGGGVFPNNQGAAIIEHLSTDMEIFRGQYHGAYVFFQEPADDVFYYSVSQDEIDAIVATRKQWFVVGQRLGEYQNYKSYEEYERDYLKNLYKYCPRKLKKLNADTKYSADEIAALQDNYDKMKAKEQSTANKLIGAVGVGATGIGAMTAASALAEQRADADAERDMKAYLETMRCNYGGGMNIKGGDTGIELPGGNDLAQLHIEYALLVESLTEMKSALGLKPGIEAEATLDKAETGLYDNGATGKTGGAYFSIARALQDPQGTDATEWEAQKADAKKKLKTGAIIAGVGAAGSLVANVIANAKVGGATVAAVTGEPHDNLSSEPSKCTYSECMAKITISDRTKLTPHYNVISDFCEKQFPGNAYCIKTMLKYSSSNVFGVKDIDTLVANNYDFDYYKSSIVSDCDTNICADKPIDTDAFILFDDSLYEYEDAVNANRNLKANLEKCFKIAGALNYFDLPIPLNNGIKATIDFDRLDCTKLDEGKSDTDVKVRDTDVTKLLEGNRYSLWQIIKSLFGKQANLVNVVE